MPPEAPLPLVAIVNTSEEVVGILQLVLAEEGYPSAVAFVPDLKRGQPSAEAFLTEHDPPVLIWDIALPYQENWQFFLSVANSPVGAGRRYVLTTTNKAVLERLVGPTGTHELVGRPFDLDEILAAVSRAAGKPSPEDEAVIEAPAGLEVTPE